MNAKAASAKAKKAAIKMRDLPEFERPVERMERKGAESLSDAELLAIILRTGSSGQNVLDLCRQMLQKFDIKRLSRTSLNQLKKFNGIGKVKASQIAACFELARRLECFESRNLKKIKSSKDAVSLLKSELSTLNKEHFRCLYLDSRNNLIRNETVSIGSLNASLIHPREIFKIALMESASAIILVHNHPSGDPTPSEEDAKITKEIMDAGRLMGIEVLDHVIIGNRKYFSFADENLI